MTAISPVIAAAESLVDQGRLDQARVTLLRHLQKQPRDGYASNLLAVVLTMAGETSQAIFHAERAMSLLPGDADVLSNAANVLSVAGRPADAVVVFRRALNLAPERWQVRQALGALLLGENHVGEAADVAKAGLRAAPDDPVLTSLLAGARLAAGHPAEAFSLFESALQHRPDDADLLVSRATTSNYVDGLEPDRIAAAHRGAGAAIERRAGRPLEPPERAPPAGPLRVGFVSSDFRRHSVAFFIEPLLRHLDRARFQPVCFSAARAEDAITARLRGRVTGWHAIHSLSDTDAAALVRKSRIDILVDLSGLGSGHRLGVFALRPAPVQATYLGYPNTTGMGSIGWRIIDAVTDPAGFESRCSEKLARIDRCFVCYSPLDQKLPEPAPRRRASGEGPVFGSFNAFRKLTDSVVGVWARLVASVPGARLVLKSAPLRDGRTREETFTRFAKAGLDPARLELLGWVESDPMQLYERIDIALDPFPYNGTTTTCEALWMGVPVVTLEGNTHAGRVGASLLTHAGLSDFIARTPEEYTGIAGALAGDAPRLERLRRELRPLVQSRLGDAVAFAGDFAAALEAMWRQSAG